MYAQGDLLGHIDVLGMCNLAKKISTNLIDNSRRRYVPGMKGANVGVQKLQVEAGKTEDVVTLNMGDEPAGINKTRA